MNVATHKAGGVTEPYFYEAAYHYIRVSPIPVNENGQCIVAEEVPLKDGSKGDVGNHTAPKQKSSLLGDAGDADEGPACPV